MDQDVSNVIKFGTDGWRGIIGLDFNMVNLSKVVVASCQELKYQFFDQVKTKKILIGYDRRFMAKQFAEAIVPYVYGCGLDPILSSSYVTTPSCSLYVKDHNFLGSLIITASHNPHNWLGLKIKSYNGCSVSKSFTNEVEKRISLRNIFETKNFEFSSLDIKKYHLEKLKSIFDIKFILQSLKTMKIKVFFDSMHGSTAKSINCLFGDIVYSNVRSIRENNNPYFGGNPPEPLIKYLDDLKQILLKESIDGFKTLGIAFDGDGDRIAVIDENGNYCSTQVLLPYFINYLGMKSNHTYPVLKTVSGSDVITRVAENQNRQVFELPVGFKYIAERMVNEQVFIGGEESGGVGFGQFLPERDGLFAAMILLSGIAEQKKYLYQSLNEIQKNFGPSFYDRVDIYFPDNSKKIILQDFISQNMPKEICNYQIIKISTTDGIKFRINNNHWVLFRFSGTEPLLRIYSEAPSNKVLQMTLNWSKNFIKNGINI